MTKIIAPNTDANTVRVFLVRHGQTDHNVEKIIQGHADIDLNSTGHAQAELVGQYLKDIPFDQVVSSDLIRCVKTTEHITKYQLGVPVRTTFNFRERNMGLAEGMSLKDALAKWGPDPEFRELAEKNDVLVQRLQTAWDQVVKESIANNHHNVCVCTHGGVLTAFSRHLHRQGFALADGLVEHELLGPFNTSITVVDVNKATKKGVIQVFGHTDHLGGDFRVKEHALR